MRQQVPAGYNSPAGQNATNSSESPVQPFFSRHMNSEGDREGAEGGGGVTYVITVVSKCAGRPDRLRTSCTSVSADATRFLK